MDSTCTIKIFAMNIGVHELGFLIASKKMIFSIVRVNIGKNLVEV